MAASFTWLKTIPNPYRLCVFGYTRNAQKLLPQNNSYFNIPSLVIFKILEFYFKRDIFTLYDMNVTINEDKTIATHNGGTYDAVYGEIIINFDSGLIYEWKIKVLDRGHGRENIGIGIVPESLCKKKETSSTEMVMDKFMSSRTENHIVCYWCCGDFGGSTEWNEKTYDKIEDNTVMMILLDLLLIQNINILRIM